MRQQPIHIKQINKCILIRQVFTATNARRRSTGGSNNSKHPIPLCPFGHKTSVVSRTRRRLPSQPCRYDEMIEHSLSVVIPLLLIQSAVQSTVGLGTDASFVNGNVIHASCTLLTLRQQKRRFHSSTSLNQVADDNIDERDNIQLFVRFSPLIGGLPFLPLHVEVVLVDGGALSSADIEESSVPSKQLEFHRFDFIPSTPTDPMNVIKLMAMQAVPGRVRYRSILKQYDSISDSCSRDSSRSDDIICTLLEGSFAKVRANNAENNNSLEEGQGVTVLLPIGYMMRDNNTAKTSTSYPAIPTAVQFTEVYRETCGRELRILGGKNCLSFALDLLLHLEETHGIVLRLSTPLIQ